MEFPLGRLVMPLHNIARYVVCTVLVYYLLRRYQPVFTLRETDIGKAWCSPAR